jgi:hypothetical protein
MPEEGFDHRFPVWTPDGRLAFTRLAIASGTSDIYVQSVPAGAPEPLIASERREAGVAFSADGRAMAYMADSPTSLAHIFVSPYPPDGSQTRVSAEGEVGLWPFWSREGLRVTYQNPNTRELKAVDIVIENWIEEIKARVPPL